MLGIATGALFLVAAVAIIVACWKRDRVHKAINSDNQDLSAPLSDYMDRAVLPETLHLSFDMTTSLNQINKYAVSKKLFSFSRIC